MPFTIPNVASASFTDQSELHEADLLIVLAGLDGTGVFSGCAVTPQGSPNMTVAVAAGVVYIDSVRVTVAGGNSAAMTADASNARFYLIEIDSAGAIQLNAGTAAANPAKPSPTTGRAVLAEVYIPASDTAIDATQITDKRVSIIPPYGRQQLKQLTTVNQATTTLANLTDMGFTVAAGETRYFDCVIFFYGGVSTTGISLAMGASSTASVELSLKAAVASTATADVIGNVNAFGTKTTGTTSPTTAATSWVAKLEGRIKNGSASPITVYPQYSGEVAATINVLLGSYLEHWT